jgi:hypothetical protein
MDSLEPGTLGRWMSSFRELLMSSFTREIAPRKLNATIHGEAAPGLGG